MSLLAQMRTGYELRKFNPSVAKRWVYPMKDNGLGVMIGLGQTAGNQNGVFGFHRSYKCSTNT